MGCGKVKEKKGDTIALIKKGWNFFLINEKKKKKKKKKQQTKKKKKKKNLFLNFEEWRIYKKKK